MTPTVTSEPMNNLAGAPTTQSMPRMIAISTRAVPRSPWKTTSPVIRPVIGTIGNSVWTQSPSTRSLRA